MPEQTAQAAKSGQKTLTPAQIRELAKKVYDLWLRELDIEKERKRLS